MSPCLPACLSWSCTKSELSLELHFALKVYFALKVHFDLKRHIAIKVHYALKVHLMLKVCFALKVHFVQVVHCTPIVNFKLKKSFALKGHLWIMEFLKIEWLLLSYPFPYPEQIPAFFTAKHSFFKDFLILLVQLLIAKLSSSSSSSSIGAELALFSANPCFMSFSSSCFISS